MSMILLRPYRDADSKTVWDLHVSVLKATGAFVDDPSLDADLLDVRKSYLSTGGDFILAELAGQVIGMGAYRIEGDNTVEITRMRVVIEHQGRGIGQKILDALELSAKSKGVRRFVLNTTNKQPIAQQFYRKNGYVEVRRELEENLTRIYFEKNF